MPHIGQPANLGVRQILGDTDPSSFAFKVNATIDTRLGLPAAKTRCPLPFTDAPLFGDVLSRREVTVEIHDADNVLPPRKHADHLAGLYWRYLEPIEPLLDRDSFYTSYQLLFAGNDIDCDEQIFFSTLNAIFALSTQVQETMPTQQRVEAGKTFFHRAWCLLRPEVVLWGPGSVETVQCLLLIARYLQCTNNLHQTWMAVGSAIRMAQSLGLHLYHESTSDVSHSDNHLGRQVWQRCVYMDRQVTLHLYTSSTNLVVEFCHGRSGGARCCH